MRIDKIYFKDMPPFFEQTQAFPKGVDGLAEVHLLIGENGTGKTRFLCMLAAAIGNGNDLASRQPVGRFCVSADGEAVFGNGSHSGVPSTNATLEQLALGQVGWKRATKGIFDEKVAAFAFRGGVRAANAPVQAFKEIKLSDWQTMLSFDRPTQPENELLCQALVNLKVQAGMHLAGPNLGEANRFVQMSKGLEDAISSVIGTSFSLQVHAAESVQLLAIVERKSMAFSSLPDGLRAIVGWLGQCVILLDRFYTNSAMPLHERAVLLIDEPETHLHPAWQRRLIPALQGLLPNTQMFVATHSPFIISSVNQGHYYLFERRVNGVGINGPIPCSSGDTWIDAVEDILGVREWYDPETEALLDKFRNLRDLFRQSFSDEALENLKSLATAIGSRSESLNSMMGREIAQLVLQFSQKNEEQ